MSIVWISHHTIFILFYGLAAVKSDRAIYEHPIMLKILGISAILTILIGGII